MFRPRLVAGCALLSLIVLAPRVFADLKSDVSEMFDAGWNPLPSNFTAAAARYEVLKQTSPGNRKVDYAFALVQLRHRKYDDALKQIDQCIATDKSNINLRRTRVWILMLTKRYPAALVEMESLGKLLPADNANDADAEDGLIATASFLGRMFGYLEGPAAGSVGDATLAETRKAIFDRLTTPRKDAFIAGRKAVLDKFAEIDLNRDQASADAKATDEELKAKLLEAAAVDRERVAGEKQELDSRLARVKADVNKELADLDGQIAPLDAQLSRLNAAAGNIQTEMFNLSSEIARLLEAADFEEDPIRADRLRFEAQRLDGIRLRYDRDLRVLGTEAAGVNSRRNALIGQRQRSAARGESEIAGLEKSLGTLRKTEARIAADERRGKQPATGNTPRTSALGAQATAFTTYEEFPFEREKARVLAELE